MKIVGLIIGSIPMIMALCGWVYELKDNNKRNKYDRSSNNNSSNRPV